MFQQRVNFVAASQDLFTVRLIYSYGAVFRGRDIYLSSKQSPTIWNIYSAVALTRPPRSYLTFILLSLMRARTHVCEECVTFSA